MRNFARRAGQLAIIPILTGVAVLGAAAPAFAAPAPQKDGTECGENVDGVNVCLITTRKPDGTATVSASVASVDGARTLQGALVVLESCDGERCNTQEVATGQDVRAVTTEAQDWGRGVGYYRANASWVDDKGAVHTGVVPPNY